MTQQEELLSRARSLLRIAEHGRGAVIEAQLRAMCQELVSEVERSRRIQAAKKSA